MKSVGVFFLLFAASLALKPGQVTRRTFAVASANAFVPVVAQAFDGSGASAYSGRSPQSKEQLKKSYQARVTADVRDFNRLGAAIGRGELADSDEWKFFFIPFQRKQADSIGRNYAALADFVGHKGESGKLEGGVGYLLAALFTKSGKPPDNTPAVKAYAKLAPTFESLRIAGEKGDTAKAQAAWQSTSVLLATYLTEVELPSDLSDPSYQ